MKKPLNTLPMPALARNGALTGMCACDLRDQEKEKTQPKPAPKPSPTPVIQDDILEAIHNSKKIYFMSRLLEEKIIDRPDETGATALMVASEWKKPLYVKDLLEQGADPNLQDGMGRAALHAADVASEAIDGSVYFILQATDVEISILKGECSVNKRKQVKFLSMESCLIHSSNPWN